MMDVIVARRFVWCLNNYVYLWPSDAKEAIIFIFGIPLFTYAFTIHVYYTQNERRCVDHTPTLIPVEMRAIQLVIDVKLYRGNPVYILIRMRLRNHSTSKEGDVKSLFQTHSLNSAFPFWTIMTA